MNTRPLLAPRQSNLQRLPHLMLLVVVAFQLGASYRTENFVVTAPSHELAREIAAAAEAERHRLAIHWLGAKLPPWQQACPIEARVGPGVSIGGETSYIFQDRQPTAWRMSVAGPRAEILASVLPHEVLHTVLATRFGRPLPRSIEEGICVTAEGDKSRRRLQHSHVFAEPHAASTVEQLLKSTRYPRNVLRFYSQGYSLTRFLLQRNGHRTLIQFLDEGLREGWDDAARRHYRIQQLGDLQQEWEAWQSNSSQPASSDPAAHPV